MRGSAVGVTGAVVVRGVVGVVGVEGVEGVETDGTFVDGGVMIVVDGGVDGVDEVDPGCGDVALSEPGSVGRGRLSPVWLGSGRF